MDESLSRVLTLAHLIIVYVLGSDEKDVLDLDLLSQHLLPAIRNLRIYMIGPHMRPLPHQYNSKIGCTLTIEAIGIQGLFHEMNSAELPPPNYICIFNGGLWGYDSWIPTLRSLNDFSGVYVLVTSYTLEEAEDDYDTLMGHWRPSVECIWEPQENPFRSTVSLPRKTQPENRPYFDNFAYQCFRC